MHRIALLLLVPAAGAIAAGCSISESISKSVSSPFEWSSASSTSSSRSSSPNRAEDYRTDVRNYTSAYVKSGGDFDSFNRGLADIAAKHGVSNWESDTNTFIGIGQGLRVAGVTPSQLEVWKNNLARGDFNKAAAMQQGYDSTK
jgi:hypothetical protein